MKLTNVTSCHVAASVKQWYQDMDVKHLPWPAQSHVDVFTCCVIHVSCCMYSHTTFVRQVRWMLTDQGTMFEIYSKAGNILAAGMDTNTHSYVSKPC